MNSNLIVFEHCDICNKELNSDYSNHYCYIYNNSLNHYYYFINIYGIIRNIDIEICSNCNIKLENNIVAVPKYLSEEQYKNYAVLYIKKKLIK